MEIIVAVLLSFLSIIHPIWSHYTLSFPTTWSIKISDPVWSYFDPIWVEKLIFLCFSAGRRRQAFNSFQLLMSGFSVSTLQLSFRPCLNSHILFITFSRSIHICNRTGPFGVSYKRTKSPGWSRDQIVLLFRDLMLQSKELAMFLGTYIHSPVGKVKAGGQRPFSTSTHQHPSSLKEMGDYIKADASPHQQGATHHFRSWMLPGQHFHEMLQAGRCSAVCHKTRTGAGQYSLCSSRKICRCSGPLWPAKKVSGKTQKWLSLSRCCSALTQKVSC